MNDRLPEIPEEKLIPKAQDGELVHSVRSLRELIDIASGKALNQLPAEESGLAEVLPFPFLALLGQLET